MGPTILGSSLIWMFYTLVIVRATYQMVRLHLGR